MPLMEADQVRFLITPFAQFDFAKAPAAFSSCNG